MKLAEQLKKLILGPEQRPIPVLGRNERCWCGSGRKYKACHMPDDDRKRSAARAAAAPGRTGGRVL
jgi:hypothetical protein